VERCIVTNHVLCGDSARKEADFASRQNLHVLGRIGITK